MRKQFLSALIKRYPNHYQLGQAVSKYYYLRESGLHEEDCEEQILGTTFNSN